MSMTCWWLSGCLLSKTGFDQQSPEFSLLQFQTTVLLLNFLAFRIYHICFHILSSYQAFEDFLPCMLL
ncbi:hypothetical protein Leryth_026839 [Lithospermum erythrorhizon]|nr:hypothetical protein Leryth_026839 [Lithospermum erythrorhizon]